MVDTHLTYARDDARRLITVTIIGPARLEDLAAVIERQAAEDVWKYAMLYDVRAVTAPLSVDATRRLVTRVAQLTIAHGARGPVAIVCRSIEEFGMARMYSLLAESRANLDSNVFFDLADAAVWLRDRMEATT
jgi:hypothetical protein